ncbi:MAG: GNAT family N-acetyltransferase [Candidatus Kerfeldbacteria bacterium]|nr:GNAT family N-acetyltransferase [Candidatus Kerfeldbacteria bacterium]
MKKPFTLHSGPITLRHLRLSDADSMATYANDRGIARNTAALPSPYRKSHATSWLKVLQREYRQKKADRLHLGIEIDGHIVGVIGIDLDGQRGTLGYWLGRPYWGQGIMTRVVRLLTAYAFRRYRLVRIDAHVFSFNIGSARVLEKAGFKREALLIKHFNKRGRLIDELIYVKFRR